VDITRVDPADAEAVAAVVGVRNAVNAADAPWLLPKTVRSVTADLTWGWDGEPDTCFLGVVDGAPVAIGTVSTTEHDNLHLAWLGSKVHPEHRRAGLGSEMLDAMVDEARRRGRTTFGADAWESEAFGAFAGAHGFEPASRAVNRRQVLADVDYDELAREHRVAMSAASAYEVVRRLGPTPDDELEAVAQMSAAMNDAPTDDLDIEDEVFSAERIRGYEQAQEKRGASLYRVFARHRGTGDLAGHTVVAVDGEVPAHAEQHDTSVVAAHRGHRLGILLKTDMNLWLREAEPQLERIDTWNAQSNDHMIGVNELLGYRILGLEIEYQRKD
jgi:RimJ/RimL family protein N-acetyltransferase